MQFLITDRIDIVVWRDYGDGYPNGKIIGGVCGEVTIDDIKDIQDELNERDCDVEIPRDTDTYTVGTKCTVHWDTGEIQYGTGYGDTYRLDGYWYFNIVGYLVRSWDIDATGRMISDEYKITEYTHEEFVQHFKYD